ncbi:MULTISPECIES: RidA family protein [unclassified Mesorhizobium]|uniref:RidA family protein n=1 Tax=unclassified Mesorhizobium TaxID=325217 RepID=UPI001FDFC551|nr:MULTISPECIES: RidA family protein [unclassified Mesorhizobium]
MTALAFATCEMVRGDIETQTEASLKALKHCLEAVGTSLDSVVMCASMPSIPVSTTPSTGSMRSIFDEPTGAQLRAGGVMADGVRYQD